jgi:hypothetical protein
VLPEAIVAANVDQLIPASELNWVRAMTRPGAGVVLERTVAERLYYYDDEYGLHEVAVGEGAIAELVREDEYGERPDPILLSQGPARAGWTSGGMARVGPRRRRPHPREDEAQGRSDTDGGCLRSAL